MNFRSLPIYNHTGGPAGWKIDFRNKEDSKICEIRIMEGIGGWDGVSARDLSNQIKGLSADTKVKLYLYSQGGDVLDGNEIYNALAAHPGGVEVEIGALCASIATVIACAGQRVTMAKNGLYMIHDPWSYAYGSSDEFRKAADIMDKMKGNIIKTYRTRAAVAIKYPEGELEKVMTEETWMTAEEALENGFIDEILETEAPEAQNLRNVLDPRRFKNSAALISRLPKEVAAPAASQPGNRTAPTQTRKTTKNKQSITDMYKEGKISVFAAAVAAGMIPLEGRIRNEAPAAELDEIRKQALRLYEFDRFGKVYNAPPEGEVDMEAVKAEAKELYKAKLKRDQEIDNMVIKVRARDKKDFSELAGEAKLGDWTVEAFAVALATSDKFKPHGVVGSGDDEPSGIEVLGIRGLVKGSPGEAFINSEAYKALAGKYAGRGSVQGKVSAETRGFGSFLNVTTSTGLTSIEKLPGVVTLGVRPLMVKDLIAPGATNNTTIRYIQESSFTNAATTVAEGGTKPAASFALAEVDAPVKKIAAYTKVTDELWADYLAVASYINQRLPYMVERTEEDQLLNGDGTGNNLTGILATAGIQTLAKGGSTAIEALYKAITKVRWGNLAGTAQGGWEPDAFVIHPTDWEAIRLSKDLNNQYFGGGPFTGAYGNGGVGGMAMSYEMLWGKPVVITPAITLGTALCGAFRLASQYFMRQGLTIESTNTDQDDFIKNLTTIRAEERLALAVYRPLGFCQVTGL